MTPKCLRLNISETLHDTGSVLLSPYKKPPTASLLVNKFYTEDSIRMLTRMDCGNTVIRCFSESEFICTCRAIIFDTCRPVF